MSAFIAKMDKQTYANVRFMKQALGMNDDEQLFKFMAFSCASEVNAQLQQVKQSLEQPAEGEEHESEHTNIW